MKSIFENIAVVVLIILIIIIPGCNGDTITPPPPDPGLIADISGAYSLHYEAVAQGFTNDPVNQHFLSSYIYISNKYHSMVISFYFPLDSVLKPGIFKFRSDIISTENYAIGGFIIDKGINEKKFISDSGTAVITEKNGLAIKGTFNFYASQIGGTGFIKVENGIINTK